MSIPRRLFEGRVALVTGGSSGIGRATVLAFAREGASVCFAARRGALGREVEAQASEHAPAAFVELDITDGGAPEALVAATLERFGRLDYAFNNAGTESGIGPMSALTEDDWDACVGVNLKATWLCMKHQIAAMGERGGVIVNNASTAALKGLSGATIYGAAKAGVLGLTRAAAIEHAAARIRVNAVCPSAVATDMIDRLFNHDEAALAGYVSLMPVGRIAAPEEVADAVIWLCSDRAAYITGHALPIDGGFAVR